MSQEQDNDQVNFKQVAVQVFGSIAASIGASVIYDKYIRGSVALSNEELQAHLDTRLDTIESGLVLPTPETEPEVA